ncbi:hypothetical protein M8J76_010974 [Diaphorina citri]|nr:hypothetical protein M8J75_013948 [Diaphorina citri]KAI5745426.1 hypothetical protein M8J76_010974 [Diaphorina citri]
MHDPSLDAHDMLLSTVFCVGLYMTVQGTPTDQVASVRPMSQEHLTSVHNEPTVQADTVRSLSKSVRSANRNTTRKRQTRRKKVPVNASTVTGRQSGVTTQRPKLYMRAQPTTPGPTDYNTEDDVFASDPTFFKAMDEAIASVDEREKRREAILKAFQANATGHFKHWPFPYTDSAYIQVFNTLKMDVFRLWKNATRDFTELRREYAPESRSLHVAEMFTSYRRQGTRFYTVFGIEGWDGNIVEYPDLPYKYKENPGSEYSVPSEMVQTRDPRVHRFTYDESRNDLEPRVRLGRYGEWLVDFTNQMSMPDGPDKLHWPFKRCEKDPDNATIFLKDLETFDDRRRKRALSTVKMRRPKRSGGVVIKMLT